MKLLVHSLLILLTISTALNGLIHRPSSFSKGKCSLFSIKQDFIPSIGLESQISHLGNFRPLSLVEYSYAFQLFPNLKNAALKNQWPSFRDLEQFEKNWMEAAASSAPLSVASACHEINFCRDTEFTCDKEFIASNFPSSLTIGNRVFSQKIFIDFASLWNCLINGVNGLRLSTSSEETLRLRGNMLIALQQVLHKQIDNLREAIVVLQYPSDVSARGTMPFSSFV